MTETLSAGRCARQRWDWHEDLRRRVEALGNRVNFLVFRYLTANDADAEDAFDGLCACCWRARGNLFVLPGSGAGYFEETQRFIWNELNSLLREYRRLGEVEIERSALAGEFRHTAKIIRNRMRDHIRKTYRQFRAEREPEPTPPSREPTRQEMKLVAAHLKGRLKAFRDALGWRNYVTLWIAAHTWPLGKTRRKRKGEIVTAIAASRKVSLQQARADKRALLRAVEDSSNPEVIALRLAGWFRWAFCLA